MSKNKGEKFPSPPRGRNENLLDAVTRGDLGKVQEYLREGADPDACRNNGSSALMLAVEHSDRAVICEVLEKGVLSDIYLTTPEGRRSVIRDILDNSPLRAFGEKDRSIVQSLLEAGADVNGRTRKGKTPLMTAAEQGNLSLMELLLNYGAEIDLCDNRGDSALMYALKLETPAAAHYLLHRGSRTDIPGGFGTTPLIAAADKGFFEVAEYLLYSGARVNHRQNDGWTALMYASYRGHGDIVLMLLENGADIEAKAKLDLTALYQASSNNRPGVVEILLKAGAKVDVPVNDGKTPLMGAAIAGNHEVIRVLLEYGADPFLRDSSGMTPLDRARERKHSKAAGDWFQEAYDTLEEAYDISIGLLEGAMKVSSGEVAGNLKGEAGVGIASPGNLVELEIHMCGARKIPAGLRERRKDVITSVKRDTDWSYLIFFGEVLAVLDGGNASRFTCYRYGGHDMFGGTDDEWEFSTGRLRMHRRTKQEISESWQRVEVEEDVVRFTGLPAGLEIEWDGKLGGEPFSMEVTFRGIRRDAADEITLLAGDLFREVRYRRSDEESKGMQVFCTEEDPLMSARKVERVRESGTLPDDDELYFF